MKRYLILLATILFIIGCVPPEEVTPTEEEPTLEETSTEPTEETTPTKTTPEETTPVTTETISFDIVIKERTVTPTELTIPIGTEVSISIEGKTIHIIQIVKAAEGTIGARVIENFGTLRDGAKVTYTFTDPGSYTIKSLKVGTVSVAVTVE